MCRQQHGSPTGAVIRYTTDKGKTVLRGGLSHWKEKIGPRDVPADRWMLLSVSVVVHDDGADLDEPVVDPALNVADLDLVPGTGLLDELAGLARGDGAYLGAG